MNYNSLVLLLLLISMQVTGAYGSLQTLPRKDIRPNWDYINWKMGKRIVPVDLTYPQRFLRSMQLVTRNPGWRDLGWTWGRRK